MSIFTKKKNLMFLLQWGGYYTSRSKDGEYGLWRLLDFNADGMHITLYSDKFDHEPTLDEALAAHPLTLHAPMSLNMLYLSEEVFVGGKQLTKDDLEGLRTYREMHDANPEWMDQTEEKLIEFSGERPSLVKLMKSGDTITVDPRPSEQEKGQAKAAWKTRDALATIKIR